VRKTRGPIQIRSGLLRGGLAVGGWQVDGPLGGETTTELFSGDAFRASAAPQELRPLKACRALVGRAIIALSFQFFVVVFREGADFVTKAEQPFPLFHIQRHRHTL
jgi:hypothetical protein